MECPACGEPTVAFAVPEAYREHAPGDAAAICTVCLTLAEVEDGPDPKEAAFSEIVESFPEGEAGAAMALAVGLLVDSLVLNRDSVTDLFEAVADEGGDPWLVLERLAAAGTVQPDADLGKLRRQLDQLWD